MGPKPLNEVIVEVGACGLPEHVGSAKGPVHVDREVAAEPKVGIFWLYDGRLLLDTTPVSEASSYGDFKIHERGHYTFWSTIQRNGLVPTDIEYDEVPRGRVGYNRNERKFYLSADACILKNNRMVEGIRGDLHLPVDTVVREDSHYKCPACTNPENERVEQEEGDWDF